MFEQLLSSSCPQLHQPSTNITTWSLAVTHNLQIHFKILVLTRNDPEVSLVVDKAMLWIIRITSPFLKCLSCGRQCAVQNKTPPNPATGEKTWGRAEERWSETSAQCVKRGGNNSKTNTEVKIIIITRITAKYTDQGRKQNTTTELLKGQISGIQHFVAPEGAWAQMALWVM